MDAAEAEEEVSRLIALGRSLAAKEAFEKANKVFSKALKILQATSGKNHPDTARCLELVGATWAQATPKNLDKAEESHSSALAIRRVALGESHKDTASSYSHLALIQCEKGNHDAGIAFCTKALEIYQLLAPGDEKDINMGGSYELLSMAHCSKEEYDKTIELSTRALALLQPILPSNSLILSKCYYHLGRAYFSKEDYTTALDFYRKSLAIDLGTFGEIHPKVAMVYNRIALVHKAEGDHHWAIEYLNKSLTITRTISGEMHHDMSATYYQLADAYASGKGDYPMAASLLKKAVRIAKATLGPTHPHTCLYEQELARYLATPCNTPRGPKSAAVTASGDPRCDYCGSSGEMQQCSRCLLKQYCSPSCQKKHWPAHKAACKPNAVGPGP